LSFSAPERLPHENQAHGSKISHDGLPRNWLEMQLKLLTEKEKRVYDQVGHEPRSNKRILNLLRQKFPNDFNETNELYRILGVLKKCLLIENTKVGYVRYV
jgi:hypothetical protein